MKFWLDAHLSPRLAPWIEKQFGVECAALRDLNLQFAKDQEIFEAARKANAIVISKDSDFQDMVLTQGPPPQILWVTCGNTSTVRMQEIFTNSFMATVALLNAGEALVEITDKK